MKILHTSDWHLGHTLYGFDRREEQENMLRQMANIVRTEKPDVFLLCGDVFHTTQPSASVNKMFVEGISSIHEANPEMTIVVIAGNHDSGSRHEIFRSLWENFGVYTIGMLHADSDESHIIEIPGKGFVIACPYVHARLLPEGFLQKLLDKVAKRNKENLPVVMTAHTTISNCKFNGHDDVTEFSVGGIDSVELDAMGHGYDYLALGHIHNKQTIHSQLNIARYSGTPLAISFDEEKDHSVTLIEIPFHGATPLLKEIGILNPKPLVTLPVEGFMEWESAKNLLKDFPDDNESYLRLNVEVTDFLPNGANEEAHRFTRNKKCKFCYINTIRKKSVEGYNEGKSFSIQQFKKESPIDILKRYTSDTNNILDNELERLFNDALSLIQIENIK